MTSFHSDVRQGFGRQSSKSPTPTTHPQNDNQTDNRVPSPSFQACSSNPNAPISSSPASPSPVPSANMPVSENNMGNQMKLKRGLPPFFCEEYAGLIVKGNFLALAVKPVHVEEGEWLAHQVVEQYRLLNLMLQIIRVIDEKTGLPICNPVVCPAMSASTHTYYWLDKEKRPVRVPACLFIQLVEKWIVGKISDPAIFPTDTSSTSCAGGLSATSASTSIPAGPANLNTPPSSLTERDWLGKSSGFPVNFGANVKDIFKQMMRCFAHLFHGHWIDAFWHINAYKELNTCFIHFITVGKLFNLIGDRDMEPMQPLIDLWLAKGLLPA